MNKPDIPYEIKTECPFFSHPANHQNLSVAFEVIAATVTIWQAYGLHLSLGCLPNGAAKQDYCFVALNELSLKCGFCQG